MVPCRSRGFSLVELIAVVVALVLIGVAVLFLLDGMRPRHRGPRPIKDATQVRGVQQAMVVWANQNAGNYPLPSELDTANATIDAPASSKDTTANILSMLIFGGYLSTEILISPAEANTAQIEQDPDYELDNPKAARDPANALWDPAFSADFTSASKGNVSYAHMLPAGDRRERWADNIITTEAVIGNRGPEITGITYDAKTGSPVCTFKIPDSLTYLIHGSRKTWEGNVAFNDGHVSFETRLAPEQLTPISVGGRLVRDTLFYDEPDPAATTNAYLGIFIRAGDTPVEFKAIWD